MEFTKEELNHILTWYAWYDHEIEEIDESILFKIEQLLRERGAR